MVSDMSEATRATVRAVLGWSPCGVGNTLRDLASSRDGAVMRGDIDRERACLLAIRAVVDSELGAPSLAGLRAEAEAAWRKAGFLGSVPPPFWAMASAAEHAERNGARGHAAVCLAAIEAVARWRRAEMEET